MKTTVALLFVCFIPAALFALVSETVTADTAIERGIAACISDSAEVKINGKLISMKRYESTVLVKKVLEACLAEIKRQNGVTVNNENLWLAANCLFKGAGSVMDPDSFGYIFSIDSSGTGVFTIAGAADGVTEIIRLNVPDFHKRTSGGYNDGINPYPGAGRFLSIEFLSGGITSAFGNFYKLNDVVLGDALKHYEYEFKKTGLKVLKKISGINRCSYILRDKNREFVMDLSSGENSCVTVFIMG